MLARIKARVFALTWLSYASYYLVRKNFSVAKKAIKDDVGISQSDLFHIDTGYLAAYAVGQFIWGFTSDRAGARRVIAFGMLATAGCSVLFGRSSAYALFALVWGLNGLAQATGWAANIKAMGGAFGAEGRGRVMGLWTTCYVVGGLVANPIAVYWLEAQGWRWAFFGPAIWVAIVGVAVLLLLPDGKEPSLTAKEEPKHDAEEARAARARVLRTPLIWVLGASYFLMKLTRYVLLFWLVYYMELEIGNGGLGYEKKLAANAALMFEVGGTAGAIVVGWASDRWFRGKRVAVSAASLVILAACLALYGRYAAAGLLPNLALLALVGFFLFGPDSLVSGAAAQDIGGPAGAATAAGIINGMGSVGPIFGSELANAMTARYGWSAFYAMLGGGALLSALILLPYARKRAT
jgi:sugar phosphate permease